MRILLLSAPYLDEYMRNARCDFVSLSATQWYPILLGYCGSYLEGRGHEVKLVDAPAHRLNREQTRAIIRDFKPDLLVAYTGHMSEVSDLEYCDGLVEELCCDAVIVGPFAGIDPEATLRQSRAISKLVSGEFETAVAEIAAKTPAAQIGGLVYKDGAVIKTNPPRAYLTGDELNAIPFVSRFLSRQVNVNNYKTPSELFPFMDIMTGRGCKWGFCTYCLWVNTFVKGMTYNVRSVENVIEELRYIEKELPHIRSVMIQDDTFTEERATAFAEARIKAGLKLPWSCYARANMGFEVLSLMKRAGVRNLHVGYESADPEVLARIKKGITVERMTRFAEDAKKAGLHIHGDFAMGFPGETPEAAKRTIDWACRHRPDTAQFQLMIPFPGTPYHAEMKANGWLTPDGQPDMPQFRNVAIRAMAKHAYRRFYLSPAHAFKVICHPYDHFFGRFKTILRAIPAMFWKEWHVSSKPS